ncbi:ornithine cyclodeaminase family protein [Dongia deserti]|uniref:ornithine cyclodeaminase family protein n=1 Tax=Dongia deserti TaxID=2268030 RepID=UPI000E6477D4|nr:ornithine cyclodeaminase family protein [Dongia deserti]
MEQSVNPLGRASAEIAKGATPVLTLSEADVTECIDLRALLDALAEGFRALALGKVVVPERPQLHIPGLGYSLSMAAWMEGMNLTVKIVNVFEGNLALGLPSHLATIQLFDPASGLPVCIMDGTYITAVRTSGSAVLSVRALAREDARVATVVGAGVQANQHLRLLPLVRDFTEIRVVSRYADDAARLARLHPGVRAMSSIEEAVRSSDVVCLATHSYEPVIETSWVRAGTHVSSVGVSTPGSEIPGDLIRNVALYVETADSFKPAPVGCCELAGLDPSHGTELGSLLLGRQPGRTSDRQITVYKAMGIAMEDMVAADLAYRNARRLGKGAIATL